jgi:hypothetical protein
LQQLQLLQPSRPLWEQLQYAAAAAAVAASNVCQPLLVLDPWKLLPELLGMESAAAAAAKQDVGGTNQWVVLQADGLLSASGSTSSTAVCSDTRQHSSSSGAAVAGRPDEVWLAVRNALLAGRNMCLQTHSSITNASALVQAVAACRSMLQLAAAEEGAASGSRGEAGPLFGAAKWSSSSRGKPVGSRRGTHSSAVDMRRPGAATAAAGDGACVGQSCIVLHVCSNSSIEDLPAELAGSCMIIDLGGLEQQQQQQQQAFVQAGQQADSGSHLPEVVLRLVLQAAGPAAVAAAAAAAEEAEEAAAQACEEESLLIARLSQVRQDSLR